MSERKDVLIAVLAAGRSTRTKSVIGDRSKMEVTVSLFSEDVPVVCYQLRYAYRLLDELKRMRLSGDVALVVGHRMKSVLGVAMSCGFYPIVVVDDAIRGIGNVWSQLARDYGDSYRYLFSMNGDDVHGMETISTVAENILKCVSCGCDGLVFGEVANYLFVSKSVYVVDSESRVLRCIEGMSGVNAKIGTGKYLISFEDLKYVEYRVDEMSGEVVPGDVLNRIIELGGKIYYREISGWVDVGNPDVLSRILVEVKR